MHKFDFPVGNDAGVTAIEFECTGERSGNVLVLSIVASFCVIDDDDNYALKAPCSSNYELLIEGSLLNTDLLPVWKHAVNNLDVEFHKIEEQRFGFNTPIDKPPDEVMMVDIDRFLDLVKWDE